MAGTYVALLYSIGIGEGRRLVMADWRSMMEDLGLQNPRTLIATGNAIFECRVAAIRTLEHQLEVAFDRRFGRRVDTIVRAAAAFRRLTAGNPFPRESERDGACVVVRVMRKPIDQESVAALTRMSLRMRSWKWSKAICGFISDRIRPVRGCSRSWHPSASGLGPFATGIRFAASTGCWGRVRRTTIDLSGWPSRFLPKALFLIFGPVTLNIFDATRFISCRRPC